MNVSSVNQMAFTGKITKTKNGNEYKKSNAGKLTGTILTTGIAGYFVHLINKNRAEMIKYCKERLIQKGMDSSDIYVNKLVRKSPVVVGVLFIAVGLGAGAVVDAIINKVRRNKADKKAVQA